MLSVQNLHVYYGGIHALSDVSLDVREGQVVALIGANGAGKSTLLRTISGLVKARSGHIKSEGEELLGKHAHEIVRMGIVMVPEGRGVFPELTTMENLYVAAYPRSDRAGIARDLEKVFELFPILRERSGQKARLLSGGEQQMLAVGRALMAKSRLLMMDEPSLGLAPQLVKGVFDTIQQIHRREEKTILLVEQNARAALQIADYAYVLETGRIVLEGTPNELAENEDVKRAYLG
jgi:branched-chain amino acid transport system ATP-binding protein